MSDTLPHKYGHMSKIINPKSFENYTLSDIFIEILDALIKMRYSL